MGKSQTTGTTGKNEPPKKPDATQKLTGGVEKGKKHSQKKSNEIDDIFNLASTSQDGSAPANEDLKAVAEEIKKARELKLAASSSQQPAAKKAKVEGSKDDLFGGDVKKGSRKRTEEGYAIYSEEELNLANIKGGDTELCPFDCDCCF